MSKKRKALVLLALILVLSFTCVGAAFALSEPTTGSLAYDLYDVGITKGLKGPIGFLIGTGCIVVGAVSVFRNPLAAIPAILAGAAIIKADGITKSLGMLL